MQSLLRCFDPRLEPIARPMLWPDLDQHDPGRLDEQGAQIAIASFRYAAEDCSVSGRDLFRYQPKPGAEVAAFREASPVPIAATTALEMIGPTPGTVITRWQASSCSTSDSMSADTAAMRSSNRRQSWTSSAMRLTILGDNAPVFKLRMSGNALRNGTTPCRTMMPRSIRKPRI